MLTATLAAALRLRGFQKWSQVCHFMKITVAESTPVTGLLIQHVHFALGLDALSTAIKTPAVAMPIAWSRPMMCLVSKTPTPQKVHSVQLCQLRYRFFFFLFFFFCFVFF